LNCTGRGKITNENISELDILVLRTRPNNTVEKTRYNLTSGKWLATKIA
jgi:hypothetical protein